MPFSISASLLELFAPAEGAGAFLLPLTGNPDEETPLAESAGRPGTSDFLAALQSALAPFAMRGAFVEKTTTDNPPSTETPVPGELPDEVPTASESSQELPGEGDPRTNVLSRPPLSWAGENVTVSAESLEQLRAALPLSFGKNGAPQALEDFIRSLRRIPDDDARERLLEVWSAASGTPLPVLAPLVHRESSSVSAPLQSKSIDTETIPGRTTSAERAREILSSSLAASLSGHLPTGILNVETPPPLLHPELPGTVSFPTTSGPHQKTGAPAVREGRPSLWTGEGIEAVGPVVDSDPGTSHTETFTSGHPAAVEHATSNGLTAEASQVGFTESASPGNFIPATPEPVSISPVEVSPAGSSTVEIPAETPFSPEQSIAPLQAAQVEEPFIGQPSIGRTPAGDERRAHPHSHIPKRTVMAGPVIDSQDVDIPLAMEAAHSSTDTQSITQSIAEPPRSRPGAEVASSFAINTDFPAVIPVAANLSIAPRVPVGGPLDLTNEPRELPSVGKAFGRGWHAPDVSAALPSGGNESIPEAMLGSDPAGSLSRTTIDQIVANSMKESHLVEHEGSQRFHMRLDPPELGRLTVEIHRNSAGHVSLHLTAASAETHVLLERHTTEITQALQDQGLSLSQFDLSHQQQGHSSGQTRHYQEQLEYSRLTREAREQFPFQSPELPASPAGSDRFSFRA